MILHQEVMSKTTATFILVNELLFSLLVQSCTGDELHRRDYLSKSKTNILYVER